MKQLRPLTAAIHPRDIRAMSQVATRPAEPATVATRPLVFTTEERSELIAQAMVKLNEGWTLNEVAKDAGVGYETLRRWMLLSAPERYQEAQANGLTQRIVEADQLLEGARTHLDASIADKRCKYARWDAERRLSKLFAPRSEITGAEGAPLIPTDAGEVARRVAFLLAQGGQLPAIEGEATRLEESAETPTVAAATNLEI